MNSTEKKFADKLTKKGIEFQFESESYIVDDNFISSWRKYQDSIYTPDFTFTINNKQVIIEIKGNNPRFIVSNAFKYRLFHKQCIDANIEFFVVKWCPKLKDFILHNQRVLKDIKQTKTIWDWLSTL